MTELSRLQNDINDHIDGRKPDPIYPKIRVGVDDGVIKELGEMDKPFFTEAVRRALETTSDGLNVFKGIATAVLMNGRGDIVAFYSNTQNSPHHGTFVKAAIEKATARVKLEKNRKRGGLSLHETLLVEQGYAPRHEGAAIKPTIINGEKYYVGVSGAAVDGQFNRKALRSDWLFAATGEEPEWRAAGYWDRFCANRIRKNLMKPKVRQEVGSILIPRHQAKNSFFD